MHEMLITYYSFTVNKSPLPLTDQRDAVPHSHRAVHRCGLDGQCDKLVTDDRHQFITLTVHLR